MTGHPPVRGEIWERRRGARRVEITEAGRADVHGRWLDTRKRCVWPARGFTERFRPALDNADYRAALPERRRRLIDEPARAIDACGWRRRLTLASVTPWSTTIIHTV